MTSLISTFRRIAKKSGMEDDRISVLSSRPPIQHISTGSLAIDCAIGPKCPGIPQGQLTQFYGGEGSGKSLLMCQIMSEAQKLDLPVFLIDREVHYTPDWFERFGGDASKVIDLQPQTIEQMIEQLVHILDAMEQTNTRGGLFVIDSLQALPTEKIYNADMFTNDRLAASAAILAARLPAIIDRIHRNNLTIVSVGQLRETPDTYGKQYTPGGNALKHFTVLRLFMRFKAPILEKLENGEEISIGFTSFIRTDKNNVGGLPRGTSTEVDFRAYGGADDTNALLKIAMQAGIVEQSGAWFKITDTDIKFHGKKNWPKHCADSAIRERIKEYAFDPEVQLKGTGYPGAVTDAPTQEDS